MIEVRPPRSLDTDDMAKLLNSIIERGGTTALTRPVTSDDISDWMGSDAARSAWHVALDASGDVVGFQWIAPNPRLPSEACEIASFVKLGRTGLGIGSALFDATAAAAARLGYVWIDATIRADNEGGLIYYQSRGFRDYAFEQNVVLQGGQTVDRIRKRYDV